MLALPAEVIAQGRSISFIRDAEIEKILEDFTRPVLLAAKLDPNAVDIYIVNDKSLNAFVAGGQNIFVHTGLLLAVDSPEQLIGVIAHETGHISGGHLVRSTEGFKTAGRAQIISMILGAAAVAIGGAEAGMAILSAGTTAAQYSLFRFSRVQESAADQAGLQFLDATGQSARGLISFLDHLGDQEALMTRNQDPYVRTHPLTRNRIARLQNVAEQSAYYNQPSDPDKVHRLMRMQAKLHGFLDSPSLTRIRYPKSDTSVYAHYARAVAFHREARLEEALTEVETLLKNAPRDPYYHELKGQILFESGKIEEAIAPYRLSNQYAPNETLLLTALAQALLATEESAYNQEAITSLKAALRQDRTNGFALHQLALAYEREGNTPLASLATAERYLMSGRIPEAVMLAREAEQGLEKNSPGWYRARDITFMIQDAMPEQDGAEQDDTQPQKLYDHANEDEN